MKCIIAFLFSIFLISCSTSPDKKENSTSNGNDTINKQESVSSSDTIINSDLLDTLSFMKKLVGKSFSDSRNIPGLEDWKFVQGTLVTPVNNPETIVADVFHKADHWIVFFSIKEDTTSTEFTILDLEEVKGVQEGWQLRAGFCRQGGIENVEIVALVKNSDSEEYLKPAKMAWRFNRDKRRFENISTNNIDCINHGLD